MAVTEQPIYQRENETLLSATRPPSTYVKCPWTCELTNDAGYVVYSALGSFYIPMLVMLFFYWRIYRAAIRTTRAINQGFRTTKGRLRTSEISAFLSSLFWLYLVHPHSVAISFCWRRYLLLFILHLLISSNDGDDGK